MKASKSAPAPRPASFRRCPSPIRHRLRRAAFGARQCSCMSLRPIRCPAGQQLQKRIARVECGKLISVYFNQKACGACASRPLCTAGKEKRIRRWEHETVLDAMQNRLDAMPDAMAIRRCTVEHVFGTIKGWMGATRFRTRGLKNVATEASLTVLAYNIKRAIAVAGVASTLKAIEG